ncbi:putative pentatricopeptide repeat-containing protein At3g05240 [Pyrus communis]|uniref:putative pentatricopeptide repeat-containing protein At3g05240 n=1 Tax=Pyrus communis TaxID=23211 RepID=UPI0035C163A1
MYAKIGDAGSAQRIFEDLQKKDVMAWTSMIIGLAMHGHGCFDEAMRLLEEMPIQPNVAMWGALLNGCKMHENFDIADQVRRYITEMEPGNGVDVFVSKV